MLKKIFCLFLFVQMMGFSILSTYVVLSPMFVIVEIQEVEDEHDPPLAKVLFGFSAEELDVEQIPSVLKFNPALAFCEKLIAQVTIPPPKQLAA